MFRPVNLRRFTQNTRATLRNQQIRGAAEGPGGADPAFAVGAAAVGAAVLHGAPGLVRDRDDAIDVGILSEQVGSPHALGEVLAVAGGAVDGADDRDVVARAKAAVAAVVAHEMPRFGGRGRRRAAA